jgi:hypothetical protein
VLRRVRKRKRGRRQERERQGRRVILDEDDHDPARSGLRLCTGWAEGADGRGGVI